MTPLSSRFQQMKLSDNNGTAIFSKILFVATFILFVTLIGCSQPANEQEDANLTTEIDNFVKKIKESEDINRVDRNKIYDLAHYLDNKYKGDLESDEIIEVVD